MDDATTSLCVLLRREMREGDERTSDLAEALTTVRVRRGFTGRGANRLPTREAEETPATRAVTAAEACIMEALIVCRVLLSCREV